MKTGRQIISRKAVQLSNHAHAKGTWDAHFAAWTANISARNHCEITQHLADASRHQQHAKQHEEILESGKTIAA